MPNPISSAGYTLAARLLAGKPVIVPIRVLHYTWIAFFMTFYVWFNLAPLATTMRASEPWLTKEHIKVLLIANVALTIPARIIVGTLIDRFGARKIALLAGGLMSTVLLALSFVDRMANAIPATIAPPIQTFSLICQVIARAMFCLISS